MFVYLRSMSNTNTIQQHSTESTLAKYQNSPKKKSLFSPNTLNFPLIARDIGYTMQNRKKKKRKNHDLSGKIKKNFTKISFHDVHFPSWRTLNWMSIVSNVSFGDSRVFIQPEWKKRVVKECVEKSGHAPFVYNGSLRGERSRQLSRWCRRRFDRYDWQFYGEHRRTFFGFTSRTKFYRRTRGRGRGQALHDVFLMLIEAWCRDRRWFRYACSLFVRIR